MSYGPPAQYGYGPPPGYGTPGTIRPTGTSIALFFGTLGIYGYVYNYQVHTEMKRYSGRGIGGGVALLLTFLAGIAMPFVTPAEVGSLYRYRGEREPVNGWTGLFYLIPRIAAYLGFIITIVVGFTFAEDKTTGHVQSHATTDGRIVLAVGLTVCAITLISGGIAWFVKTNSALNRFWQSVGAV